MRFSLLFDKIGICVSAICLVHCLAIPVLLIFGLDTFLRLIDQEWLEIVIIVCTFLVGSLAFFLGYLNHRQHFVPVLFVAGFLLLVNGEALESKAIALVLSISGAAILIYAHLQNLHFKRKHHVG